MPNRLATETSPYLLQHAENPVDWYPWGEEAFELARTQKKPVLLSIGYSACHWCHVMAHESFEDAATAKVMNELFVNIKVDREERPDVDKIYQTAQQLLTQRTGGWPLTMFLNPDDQRPFFGGTYFPNEARHGLPAFTELLGSVAKYFAEQHEQVVAQGAKLTEVLGRLAPPPAENGQVLSEEPLHKLRKSLADSFDSEYGGFGQAPKFPHPTSIDWLLRRWRASASDADPDIEALYMATLTLTRMADGGIYDHIGGGFCRYSVDRYWQIPHFDLRPGVPGHRGVFVRRISQCNRRLDARGHAVAGRRLLCHARRRLGRRGRPLLRVDTRRSQRAPRRERLHCIRGTLRIERPGEFRRPLAPDRSPVAGRHCRRRQLNA
jgi:uncharacterized protein YyaL (SSP411 family)